MIRGGGGLWLFSPVQTFFFFFAPDQKQVFFFLSGKVTSKFFSSILPYVSGSFVNKLVIFTVFWTNYYFITFCWTIFISKNTHSPPPTSHLVGPLGLYSRGLLRKQFTQAVCIRTLFKVTICIKRQCSDCYYDSEDCMTYALSSLWLAYRKQGWEVRAPRVMDNNDYDYSPYKGS